MSLSGSSANSNGSLFVPGDEGARTLDVGIRLVQGDNEQAVRIDPKALPSATHPANLSIPAFVIDGVCRMAGVFNIVNTFKIFLTDS